MQFVLTHEGKDIYVQISEEMEVGITYSFKDDAYYGQLHSDLWELMFDAFACTDLRELEFYRGILLEIAKGAGIRTIMQRDDIAKHT